MSSFFRKGELILVSIILFLMGGWLLHTGLFEYKIKKKTSFIPLFPFFSTKFAEEIPIETYGKQ
jgi:hypothetical protein